MATGPEETEPPTEGLSTAQLASALNISRSTVNVWKDRRLLPSPTVVFLGARGKASFWPAYAEHLGQYVKEALEAHRTVAQVARAVEPLLGKDAAWVNEQLASGKTIAALVRELQTKVL